MLSCMIGSIMHSDYLDPAKRYLEMRLLSIEFG